MCNTLKKEMDDITFIKVCEHILSYLGIIDSKLYPEYFCDYISGNFNKYMNSASDKNIDFGLTENEFYQIINEKCYLCGKENSNVHNNGIDRINSYIGYYIKNCKACCGTCNYLKNSYDIITLFSKLIKICKKHKIINTSIDKKLIKIKCLDIYKIQIFNNNDDIIINEKKLLLKHQRNYRDRKRKEMGDDKYKEMLRIQKATQNGNINADGSIPPKRIKKTKEEIREQARLRKQKQRELLKEKYGNEEYNKIRAAEIAKNRAEKNNNI